MADMWTVLSITDAQPAYLDQDGEPRSLVSDLKDISIYSFEDNAGGVVLITDDEGRAAGWSVSGWSKYQRDEIHEFAILYTTAVPGARAEIFEEWRGEEPGTETLVFRGGERVHGEEKVSQLVPVNLAELIAAVRKAAADLNATADGDSNDAEIEAGQELRDVALALADALS